MKVLVTGGAGFIGSHFVDFLLKNQNINEIYVLDKLTYAGNLRNLPTKTNNCKIHFYNDDINNIDKYLKELDGLDYIVNFAAETHVDNSIKDSDLFIQTNIVGVHKLLKFALQNRVKKFLQVSTDEVYGSIKKGSWNEDQPLLPNSPYSASKASADLLVRSFSKTYGLNTNITRSSNNYGPRQFPEKFIPVLINRSLMLEKVPIYGTGTNVRDWLHVTDHCRGIFLVLENGIAGETYNIGGGVELDNNSMAKHVLNYLGLPISNISYVEDRLGHDYRYSVDWSKIRNELGYFPKQDFFEELKSTIDWYRENPNWWVK